MAYTSEQLTWIYERTSGRCHLCHGTLAWRNYGIHGRRGAWEVDHDTPRAVGGPHRMTNFMPAHTDCNRSKGARPTDLVRGANGLTRAPISAADGLRIRRAVLGGLAGLFFASAKKAPVLEAIAAGALLGAATVNDDPPPE